MNADNLALATLNTTAFMLCVGFLLYVVFIMRPFLSRTDGVPGSREGHDFHFVVPCLDEERVVGGTVRHLLGTFPEATVWVVDDGSTDLTPDILADLQGQFPQLHVLTRTLPDARRGKGAALNHAWRAIAASLPDDADRHRVVVGVLDADARLERLAPDVICGYLVDPRVAAVQVQVRVTDDIDGLAAADLDSLVDPDDRLPARKGLPAGPAAGHGVHRPDRGDAEPAPAHRQRRHGRQRPVHPDGRARPHRRRVRHAVARRPPRGLRARAARAAHRRPHRVLRRDVRGPDGSAEDQAAAAPAQPVGPGRHAVPALPVGDHLLPAGEPAGALEIAYYLWVPWSQLLGSVVFPAAVAVQVWFMTHTGDGVTDWWTQGAWGLVPLAALFGVLPHVVWGPVYRSRSGGAVTRRRAFVLGLVNVLYAYLLQAAVWWALIRLLRGRRDWKKTAHDGPGHRGPGREAAPVEPARFAALPADPDWLSDDALAEALAAEVRAAAPRAPRLPEARSAEVPVAVVAEAPAAVVADEPPTAAQPRVGGGASRPAVRPTRSRAVAAPAPSADGPSTERIPQVLLGGEQPERRRRPAPPAPTDPDTRTHP